MKTQSIQWKLLACLAVVVILAGCAAPTATPVPTVDMAPTLAALQAQAVQTVYAQMTASAPTATPVTPTSTATNTLEPTQTFTPAPPTATPTATFRPWTLTPAYSATPADYGCKLTSVSPSSNTEFKVGESFDGKWVVKNTGTQTWTANEMDIRFASGTNFQKSGATLLDLGADVAPDNSYTVVIDMVAPANTGTYSTSWTMNQGGGAVCTLNLTIKTVN